MTSGPDAPGKGGGPALLPAPGEQADPEADHEEALDGPATGEGWRVVLFDDDTHGMDEVAVQIVVAIGCDWPMAVEIMLRVHNHGRATVTIAAKTEADRVAAVLRRIALRVKVEKVG